MSDRQTDVNTEAGLSTTNLDYFQTYTSYVEELLDSSGAETTKDPPFLISLDNLSTAETEVSKETEPAPPGGIADSKFLSPSRPLSASARTLINQHFAETNPSILPVGHSTVAFNQGQVHSILRAVSSETLIEKYAGGSHESRGTHTWQFARNQSPENQMLPKTVQRSDASGPDSDPGTEGYTSGALSSDDEFIVISQTRIREIVITRPPDHPAKTRPALQSPLQVIRAPVQDIALQTMSLCQIWL